MRIERVHSVPLNQRSLNGNRISNVNKAPNYSNPSFQRLVIGDKGRKVLALAGSMFYAAAISTLSNIGLALVALPTIALLWGTAKWAANAPEEAQGFIHNLPSKKTKKDVEETKEKV